MSTTIDKLLTVYEVDDKYSAKVDRMIKKTEEFDRAYKRLGGGGVMNLAKAFSSVGGGPVAMLSKVVSVGTQAAAVLGAAGVAASAFAVQQATDYDTMTRKLEAFLGSAEQAASTMRFIENLAGPSLFETKDLAQASTLLAAYGLNVEKVLPLADKLASAFGDSGEAVSEVARVFGRLKSGDFGEAFERLRDFGISYDDLRAKGLEFSKSNEYLGTRLQALAAVSSIIEQKFGRISDIMRDSPAARQASAMDALRKSSIQAGNVFLQTLTPALEQFTHILNFLNQQQVFATIAQGVTGLGQSLGNAFGGGQRALFTFIAALEELPAIVTSVGRSVWNTLEGVWSLLTGPLVKVGQLMTELTGRNFDFSLSGTVGRAGRLFAGLNDAFGGTDFGGISDRVGARVDQLMAKFVAFDLQSKLTPAAAFAGSAGGFTADDNALNQTHKVLDDIAGNTRQTAENTMRAIDLRRYALGGGEIGALGITPIEMYGGRGSSRNVTINVSPNNRLSQAVAEIARQVIEQVELQRNGGR